MLGGTEFAGSASMYINTTLLYSNGTNISLQNVYTRGVTMDTYVTLLLKIEHCRMYKHEVLIYIQKRSDTIYLYTNTTPLCLNVK